MSAPVTGIRYQALVAEPDINRRGRLKQAALAINSFKRIDQVSLLTEATNKINSDPNWDVLFLSSDFGEAPLVEFVMRIIKEQQAHDYAFVVVLKKPDEQALLAKLLMCGVHAFLCEPYSVDRINEITQIVTKVKGQAAIKRKKAAALLLVQTISRELDRLAAYLARGFNVERAKKKFQEACNSLRQFQDDSLQIYCDVAVETFEKALPTAAGNYGGASKRVKEKLEAKLREQYEAELKEAEGAGATAASADPK